MCWLPVEITDNNKTLMFEDKSSKGTVCEYCIAKDDKKLNKLCTNCIYKEDK